MSPTCHLAVCRCLMLSFLILPVLAPLTGCSGGSSTPGEEVTVNDDDTVGTSSDAGCVITAPVTPVDPATIAEQIPQGAEVKGYGSVRVTPDLNVELSSDSVGVASVDLMAREIRFWLASGWVGTVSPIRSGTSDTHECTLRQVSWGDWNGIEKFSSSGTSVAWVAGDGFSFIVY